MLLMMEGSGQIHTLACDMLWFILCEQNI